MKTHSSVCSARRSLFPALIFFAAGSSVSFAAVPPLAHDLASAHFEFSDFGGSHDYLIWQGSAPSYDVYRAIDHQPLTYLATVPGTSGGQTLSIIQYMASPIAAPTSVAMYRVLGYSRTGANFTNWISIQELFEDPGFERGPSTTAWSQIMTYDIDGYSYWANFIQGEPGNCSAVMGGEESRNDIIYTSKPLFIPDGTMAISSASLSLSGTFAVATEESPTETVAYDNLDVEVREIHTGNLISTHHICDNRNSGYTGRVPFYIDMDFRALYGATVQLIFRARNDEIYPTTFTIDHVELDENIVYR